MSAFVTYPMRFHAPWRLDTTDSDIVAHLAVSGVTDPGCSKSRVNQDTFFAYGDAPHAAVVLGVFDGHGKECGRDVALAARNYFESRFQSFTREDYDALAQQPQQTFSDMFAACHDAIKGVVRALYERRGFTVKEQNGYLVKAMSSNATASASFTCVRGGTTATIVVILDAGRRVFVANVGDSCAMIDTKAPILKLTDLIAHDENRELLRSHDDTGLDIKDKSKASKTTDMLVLTGEHSPDNESEFLRAREFRRCSFNREMPALRFLFDACDPRSKRTQMYHFGSDGDLRRKREGDYLKNVRDEWATVVATPDECVYPDALAFTRSLGDFHMHTFGVSCEPSVREISLEKIVRRRMLRQQSGDEEMQTIDNNNGEEDDDDDAATSTDSGNNNNDTEEANKSLVEFMLVVASDGVWDTWKYDELFRFIHKNGDKEAQVKRNEDVASAAETMYPIDKAVAALLAANLKRARRIFGDDADNMTAVLCHFQMHLAPPAS
uniref:PPM-type phosphatase domain-containing protein n=1 Tax=Globisporangium ultimum (strain ATCC 200006 / CBS 805.95 / DAOM BR144) TaxID=431595 RepID=K3WZS3_GLOUD